MSRRGEFFARPWDSQPQDAVGVDSAGLAAGLIAAFDYSREIGGGALEQVTSDLGVSATPFGIGRVYTQAGGNYSRASRNISPKTVAGSVLVVFVADSLAGTVSLFSTTGDASNYAGFAGSVSTTGVVEVLLGDGAGSSASDRRSHITAAGAVVAGRPYAMAFAASSVTSVGTMYLNGARQSLTLTGTAGTYSPGASEQPGLIGGRLVGPLYGDKRILLFASWGRTLTGNELAQLSANPWQLFEPRRIYIPTAATPSGTPTLSAATFVPGSITATGFRPRVTVTF